MWNRLTCLASTSAAVIAGALWYRHTHNLVLPCGLGECERVLTSQFATAFGLPTAAWGFFASVAVLLISLSKPFFPTTIARRLSLFNLALFLPAVLVALILLGLQIFVIKAYCMWCLSFDLAIFVAFVSTIVELRFPLQLEPVLRAKELRVLALITIAIAVIGGAVAQSLLANVQKSLDEAAANLPKLSVTQLVNENSLILGDEKAPITIVEFLDFNCSCRANHPFLKKLAQERGGQIRLVARFLPYKSASSGLLPYLAIQAASEYGKGWDMLDKLVAEVPPYSEIHLPDLKDWAEGIGLPGSEFMKKIQTEEIRQKVIAKGAEVGIWAYNYLPFT